MKLNQLGNNLSCALKYLFITILCLFIFSNANLTFAQVQSQSSSNYILSVHPLEDLEKPALQKIELEEQKELKLSYAGKNESPSLDILEKNSSIILRNSGLEIVQDNTESSNIIPPLGIPYRENPIASMAINKNITFFSERLKERFSIWLERSAKYLEIMKDILDERGLPEELVFLPIIESGFNMNAYSRASAVGPWQFIAGTAKRYGLTIDWWRDERKDPVKSTEAAASYLRDLYKMFGTWPLALAAYNAGEGRIMRALKKTGSEDYWSLLKTKQLHNETKQYVPRYIAATKIARMPSNYGFEELEYHKPLEFEEITITEPLDIEVIALAAETTVQKIKELNPELRRWCTPLNVKEYTIRVPVNSKELFFENLDTIPKDQRLSVDKYVVQKGDTIKNIAQKTGIPFQVILIMNSLQGIERLTPGDKINLPPKDKFVLDLDDRRQAKKSSINKVSYKKTDKKSKDKTKKKTAKKKMKT
ncbi:MAG TPA: transglycosylase SLT domain-containing protein [Nitrospirae bacterium]|nr:transglycosylase SLT domain-containing protein [Nitrospirota bacterium]